MSQHPPASLTERTLMVFFSVLPVASVVVVGVCVARNAGLL